MKQLRILASLFFLFSAFTTLAQDTTYYNVDGRVVDSFVDCDYLKIRQIDEQDSLKGINTEYYRNGQKRSISYFNTATKIEYGRAETWHRSGQLKSSIEYSNGKKSGELLTYWEDGTKKREDKYLNDSLIDGNCFDSDGNMHVFFDYMVMPYYFICGEKVSRKEIDDCSNIRTFKYILENVKYPMTAKDNGISGTVYVSYIINKKGFIEDVKIQRGVENGAGLNEEALRVVKEIPQMVPGIRDGEPVRVQYTVPVRFNLRTDPIKKKKKRKRKK